MVESLLVPLICGIIMGWLGGLATRGSGFGLTGNMIAAVIGALIFAYLYRAVGFTLIGGVTDAAVISFAGAFLTLAVIGEMRR